MSFQNDFARKTFQIEHEKIQMLPPKFFKLNLLKHQVRISDEL